jgi:hypothetical protein
MDKVRVFLNIMWQQRFWVLSVVGTLACLICWMMAASKLQAEFKADKTAIEGKFSDMTAIISKPVHGNEAVNARESKEASIIAKSVKDLWQKLYDHQRKEVLHWPTKVLGDDFGRDIEKLSFGQDISSTDYRIRYLNYIKNRFDSLVEMVNAQKMPEIDSAIGAPESARMTMPVVDPNDPLAQPNYWVLWLDQGALQGKLTFQSTPTSKQIWVTQEDLWVYETLLKAINNVNKERGTTRPDNAAIRIIQYLQVGREAADASLAQGNILMPAAAAAAGGEAGPGMGAEPGMRGEMGPGMPGGPEGQGSQSIDAALLQRRYVDAEGKPIEDGSTVTGQGQEYRRLPVRMLLMMDQKWLPRMLVECANAPLPIEVKRLRINPEKSAAGFSMETTGGPGMGPGMGMGRSPEAAMMSRGPAPMMAGGGEFSSMQLPSDLSTAGLATVEIQGLVYIFNPPDPAMLSVPGGAEAGGTQNLASNNP